MGFFDQHKALIITVLIFSLLLLVMYNVKLSNEREEFEQMLVDLEEFQPEQPEEKSQAEAEEEPEKQPPTPQNNVQTHQAYNQNREQNQKSFQSRLNEIFEKNSAEQSASEEESTKTSSGNININSREEKKQKQSDGNNSSNDISSGAGNFQNSSISFSLVGRTAINIPNPIYTCDRSGKIVINIVVNEEGAVTDTSLNKGSSTSRNECLINNALEYASGAVFSRLSGRSAQKGTITYYFQG